MSTDLRALKAVGKCLKKIRRCQKRNQEVSALMTSCGLRASRKQGARDSSPPRIFKSSFATILSRTSRLCRSNLSRSELFHSSAQVQRTLKALIFRVFFQAHNLKAAGSNPAPATLQNFTKPPQTLTKATLDSSSTICYRVLLVATKNR
jgi:hypothetical protein